MTKISYDLATFLFRSYELRPLRAWELVFKEKPYEFHRRDFQFELYREFIEYTHGGVLVFDEENELVNKSNRFRVLSLW